MKSARQPERAIAATFSTRCSAASDACPTQCFLSGTIAAKSSWLYRVWIITLSSPKRMRGPHVSSSAMTSATGRKRNFDPL